MEISINVLQNDSLKAFSLFTMIARSAKDPSKGMQVPSLDISNLSSPEHTKATQRLEEAHTNVEQRRRRMATSYDVKAPSPEEIAAIHSLYLRGKEDLMSQGVNQSTPIGESRMSNAEVMHSQ